MSAATLRWVDYVISIAAVFLKSWAGLCISVLSLIVAALAYLNSRKAVGIAKAEHGWRAQDRQRQEAELAMAATEKDWCEQMRERLEAAPLVPIPIPPEGPYREWAERGAGKYFRIGRLPSGPHLYELHAKLAGDSKA